MTVVTIDKDFRVTIPPELRHRLNIEPGMKVQVEGNAGTITVTLPEKNNQEEDMKAARVQLSDSEPLYEPGELIKRTDIHRRFGGQQQGGISTPAVID